MLTLCGVLKDIILVVASMVIWGTIVTGLQFIGYSVALGGLVFYKLGAEKIKEHLGTIKLSFKERKPLGLCAVGGAVVFVLVLVWYALAGPGYEN